MAHNKRMGIRAGRLLGRNPPPMLACPLTPIHAPMPRAAVKIIDDRGIESLKVG